MKYAISQYQFVRPQSAILSSPTATGGLRSRVHVVITDDISMGPAFMQLETPILDPQDMRHH